MQATIQSILCVSLRENRTAFNLQWLEKDTVLRYDTNITYTWDPYKSRGNDPDRDIVTTINVPLIVSQGGPSTAESCQDPYYISLLQFLSLEYCVSHMTFVCNTSCPDSGVALV